MRAPIGVAGSDDLRTQLSRPGSSAACQKMTVEWNGPVLVTKNYVRSPCFQQYLGNPHVHE